MKHGGLSVSANCTDVQTQSCRWRGKRFKNGNISLFLPVVLSHKVGNAASERAGKKLKGSK